MFRSRLSILERADEPTQGILETTCLGFEVLGIEERRPLTKGGSLMDKQRRLHLSVPKGGALIGLVSVRDFLRLVSLDDF